MPIDIDALTESELIDLNHRVVARLRFLGTVHRTRRGMKLRDEACRVNQVWNIN